MVSVNFAAVGLELEDSRILDSINLTLTEQRIGVIGLNGSGKSSLVRLINGLLMPSAGQVTVDGMNTRKFGARIRRLVGFVFQNPQNQLVMPVVEEDLKFGLKNLGIKGAAANEVIGEVLNQLDADDLLKRSTYQLSGGQKQLIALASVLVMRPKMIILDEPVTSLDLLNRNRLIRLLDQLPQQILTITHDLEMLQDYDRVLLIDKGRVAADGRPAEVVDQYLELCR